MFDTLQDFAQRPEPFAVYTARELWTDPHIAQQMLEAHLDPASGRASRRPRDIDAAVAWIDDQLGLQGSRVCDLGCGPGLYTTRFHDKGAIVWGVDVSRNSLQHAVAEAAGSGRQIDYRATDYTQGDLPQNMDVFTLIFCDFCVLSAQQRAVLLAKIRSSLVPGGHLVLDVYSQVDFAQFVERDVISHRLMDGFWSPGEYTGLMKSFKYEAQKVTLERYLILEPTRHWQIYNWLTYFTRDTLDTELTHAGFAIQTLAGSLAGDAVAPTSGTLGVVAVTL